MTVSSQPFVNAMLAGQVKHATSVFPILNALKRGSISVSTPTTAFARDQKMTKLLPMTSSFALNLCLHDSFT